MNQYCRYCANASPQDYDLCYCDFKKEILRKPSCVRANKCKEFEFNEIDVFGFDCDKRYKPRIAVEKVPDLEQLKFL